MSAIKGKRRGGAVALPTMMAELAFSSWETIVHRSWMIACGNCSTAEYQRMLLEKLTAAQLSAMAFLLPANAATLHRALSPWHSSATANAKRLRRR